MPDRSAGVQQGRTWFVFLCDHEEYHGDYARALEMAEKFLAGGTNKEEPREGEQETGMSAADERVELRRKQLLRVREGLVDDAQIDAIDWLLDAATADRAALLESLDRTMAELREPGSPPDGSVARELRLTASRLRDPEYHWYEHAAVTLERLADELEKG